MMALAALVLALALAAMAAAAVVALALAALVEAMVAVDPALGFGTLASTPGLSTQPHR